MSGADVVVEHVSKSFDHGRVAALEDVSLAIEPGELVALTGPSGCGKSTLLNLIGLLDRPDGGEIRVAGQSLATLPDPAAYRASVVGFVFQFHNLIWTLSPTENVEVPMLGRLRRAERTARARELLAEVGLRHRLTTKPATLSGGERQRVALARALANEPSLLLADEPTGALDAETGRQILRLLDEVRERRGTTILLVTNDDQVAAAADRSLRIRHGRIVGSEEAAATRAGAPGPA